MRPHSAASSRRSVTLVTVAIVLAIVILMLYPESAASDGGRRVARGEYLARILACERCHTEGALVAGGEMGAPFAGSRIGIAYTDGGARGAGGLPGVVFAPNLTPDAETGLGEWTRRDIAAAIQTGVDHNGGRLRLVMPWANYSVLTERDTLAIAAYLQSLDPVSNRVPDPVPAGARSGSPYVRFGVYLFSPDGDLVEPRSGSPTGGLR